MRSNSARQAMRKVLEPIVEPILHPSEWRIRALGLSTAVGHPLFYVFWSRWLPQPYESLWQRILMSLLGVVLLMAPQFRERPPGRGATIAFTTIFWVTLPLYFTWMYLCNGGNTVWLASEVAMFLIYYHLTDWRIATIGLVTALPVAWVLFEWFGPAMPPIPAQTLATHAIVVAFAWYMGAMLGLSSSNLRREQLTQTLGTMGIMAHELRTPLATMSLVSDAMRNEAADMQPEQARSLEQLAQRLNVLVRNMNRVIDMQISNARLLTLPSQNDMVHAGALVQQTAAFYPYRNDRERDCVVVEVVRDFAFHGSETLFTQVIDNLLKNAMRSLAAMPTPRAPGDLRLTVDVPGRRGSIVVADRGQGIGEAVRLRLFQPFVSTNRGTGHGLGLAFCQRVVRAAGGTIRVESAPGEGARFIIELPLASPEAVQTTAPTRSTP